MEYWITDGTETIYCDGDVCGLNHEGVVVMHAATTCLDKIVESSHPLSYELSSILEELTSCGDGIDQPMLRTSIGDQIDHWVKSKYLTSEEATNINEFVIKTFSLDKDLWDITNGFYDGDPRDYALEHFNWIRIAGRSVQCYRPTRENLRRIYEVMTDSDIVHAVYDYINLETFKPHKYLRNIPIEFLPDGFAKVSRECQVTY